MIREDLGRVSRAAVRFSCVSCGSAHEFVGLAAGDEIDHHCGRGRFGSWWTVREAARRA